MKQVSSTTPLAHSAWWTAAIAGMASYLDGAALQSVGSGVTFMQKAIGLSTWDLGLLNGLLTATVAIGALVGGRLGDAFGRRRVFGTTMIFYALGTGLMIFVTAHWLIYLAVLLIGSAVGADLPVCLAIASERAPEKDRGKIVLLSTFLWIVGVAMTQVVTATVHGSSLTVARALFIHLFVIALIVMALRQTIPESNEWVRAKEAAATATAQPSSVKRLFQAPLVTPMLVLGAYYALCLSGSPIILNYGAYLWTTIAGASVQMFAMASLVQLTIMVVMILVFMRLVDTRFRMVIYSIGALIMLAILAALLLFGAMVPALFAFSIGMGFAGPLAGESVYKVWSQEKFPTLYRGTAQGVTMAVARGVAVLMTVLAPTLLATSHRLFFGIIFAVTAASLAIGAFIAPKLPTYGKGDVVIDTAGHRGATSHTSAADARRA